jgi:hypothetical protein
MIRTLAGLLDSLTQREVELIAQSFGDGRNLP